MSSETVIEVCNVSKTYRIYGKPSDRLAEWLFKRPRGQTVHSLQDVSFTVERGDTVGIVGRNGAGKSTVLQIIAGTLSPTKGTVNVKGRLVALLELGAGFNMEYTGEENVYLYGSILGLSKEEIRNRYDEILEFAEIGEFIHYPVKTYSSGMFVRLAFAVAINVSPEILIVDEALSVGDVQFQHKCIAKLKELQARGCTILFVSHDIDTVKSLCERAVLLYKGSVDMIGTPDLIANRYMQLMHEEQIEKRRTRQLDQGEVFTVSQDLDWTPEKYPDSERHGIGEASLVRILLEDSQGRALDQVTYGERLKARFLIEYHQDIPSEINVGILLRDDKGIDILGDDSWNHQCLLPAGKATSRFVLQFEFPHLWLKPGTYSLTVALGAMSEDRATWNDYYYDWIDRAKVLTVRNKPGTRIWSKVLLPADVSVES